MALIDLDSIDHYATADIGKKTWTFTSTTNSANCTVQSGGRNSTNCIRIQRDTALTPSSNGCGVIRGHDPLATVVYGFAVKNSANWGEIGTTGTLRHQHFAIMQGNVPHLVFQMLSTGAIYCYKVNAGTSTYIGSTAGGLISADTWHYVEIKANINAATGTVEVRVNGVSEMALTGQDTANTSGVGNFADGIALLAVAPTGSGAAEYVYYDDLYITDSTGASPWNGFLGDIHVKALLPETPNGNYTAWTPSTGTDHWVLVDESTPNTTDYVESSTLGQKDSFNFPALNIDNATIMGVQLNFAAQKDDSGNSLIKPLARISATDYTYSPGVAVTTGQSYSRYIWQVSPATATNWTEAEIDAAEFGMELG